MSYFEHEGNRIFYEEIGEGKPLILLHGNTASSKMLAPIMPLFSEKHHVITMDFLGCGQSDRLREWPADLWYEWSKQVIALCDHLNFSKVDLIGCSGGALAAINVALENPEHIDAVVADSFEGLKANASITEQIRIGRSLSLIHISEPTRLYSISYAVFCLKKIFLMIRRPPRSTQLYSSAASDVYKRQKL